MFDSSFPSQFHPVSPGNCHDLTVWNVPSACTGITCVAALPTRTRHSHQSFLAFRLLREETETIDQKPQERQEIDVGWSLLLSNQPMLHTFESSGEWQDGCPHVEITEQDYAKFNAFFFANIEGRASLHYTQGILKFISEVTGILSLTR